MSDLRYKQGQELEWITPESGVSSIAIGRVFRGEPECPQVTSIRVVMEDGLHCGIPHFAVMAGDELLVKYNALQCFASGPVRSTPESSGGQTDE